MSGSGTSSLKSTGGYSDRGKAEQRGDTKQSQVTNFHGWIPFGLRSV